MVCKVCGYKEMLGIHTNGIYSNSHKFEPIKEAEMEGKDKIIHDIAVVIDARINNVADAGLIALKIYEWVFEKEIARLTAENLRLKEFAEMYYEWQAGHGSIAAMADHEVFKKMKKGREASSQGGSE